mgnify:CR=1 FL=1
MLSGSGNGSDGRIHDWARKAAVRLRQLFDRRRAPRRRIPMLVVHHWTGGPPEPKEVVNISERGAYIKGMDRWSRGTILDLTLQYGEPDGESRAEPNYLHVKASVARWDRGGVGVKFIHTRWRDRLALRAFLKAAEMSGAETGGRGAERQGQALIEFALILPLLLLLILNVVNFAAYIYAGITIANAARAGAQYMILGGAWVGEPVPAPHGQVINVVMQDASVLPNAGSLQVRVCTNNAGSVTCTGSGSFPSPPADPEAGLYVLASVDVNYTYQPLIPAFDFPGLGIHLTLPASNMHRRAVMRMVQ